MKYLQYFRSPGRRNVERIIRERITSAYENVPYYYSLMQQNDLSPHDFSDIETFIQKFPRTSTETYRMVQQERGPEYLIDQRFRLQDLIEVQSSGSSGIPVSIYKTKKEKQADNAKTLWYLMRGGLRPWHKTLTVGDPANVTERDSFLQMFGIFRRYFGPSSLPIKQIIDMIEKHSINSIYGHKSTIRLIAEKYAGWQRPPLRLAFLMPGSEVITRSDRALFKKVFQPKRYCEFYGTSETGIIAVKCGNGYHVNYSSVFFCLSSTETINGQTSGHIVLTALDLAAQPILMIDVGDNVTVNDYGNLLNLKASILRINGRKNDDLILPGGEKISAMAFLSVLDKPRYIQQFQIIQDNTEACRILVKPGHDFENYTAELKRLLDVLLAGKITFRIERVEQIPVSKNGKTKILISNL